nr:uncharacterized protein LOC127484808 [Oryctolagus cuniculus]
MSITVTNLMSFQGNDSDTENRDSPNRTRHPAGKLKDKTCQSPLMRPSKLSTCSHEHAVCGSSTRSRTAYLYCGQAQEGCSFLDTPSTERPVGWRPCVRFLATSRCPAVAEPASHQASEENLVSLECEKALSPTPEQKPRHCTARGCRPGREQSFRTASARPAGQEHRGLLREGQCQVHRDVAASLVRYRSTGPSPPETCRARFASCCPGSSTSTRAWMARRPSRSSADAGELLCSSSTFFVLVISV